MFSKKQSFVGLSASFFGRQISKGNYQTDNPKKEMHYCSKLIFLHKEVSETGIFQFKDGAFYCYCAYVLRIARYSGFL